MLFWSGLLAHSARLYRIHRSKRLKPSLIVAEGTITNIRIENSTRTSTSNGKTTTRRVRKYFPVISFHDKEGQARTFSYELGQERTVNVYNGVAREPKNPYTIGERIEVLYHPKNECEPMINSWWGLYGMSTGMIAGGSVFCIAGAVGLYILTPKVIEAVTAFFTRTP